MFFPGDLLKIYCAIKIFTYFRFFSRLHTERSRKWNWKGLFEISSCVYAPFANIFLIPIIFFSFFLAHEHWCLLSSSRKHGIQCQEQHNNKPMFKSLQNIFMWVVGILRFSSIFCRISPVWDAFILKEKMRELSFDSLSLSLARAYKSQQHSQIFLRTEFSVDILLDSNNKKNLSIPTHLHLNPTKFFNIFIFSWLFSLQSINDSTYQVSFDENFLNESSLLFACKLFFSSSQLCVFYEAYVGWFHDFVKHYGTLYSSIQYHQVQCLG